MPCMTAADPRDPRDSGDPRDPRDQGGFPPDDLPPDAPPPRPERPPRNMSGWFGFALAGAAFLASLLVAWTGSVILAALGLALSVTGVVRAYRGRATNGAAAAGGIVLAILTIALGFFWAHQAQPCIPLSRDTARFNQCYHDHA